jgi:Ca-activated chloride channel family protein
VRQLHRGALLLFSALILSCHRDSATGTKEKGAIVAVDVEVPSGGDGSALSRCDREGKKCSPLAKDDTVSPGTLVKSTRGARAAFALGPSANLDVGDESTVYLASGSNLEVSQGSIVVRKLGTADADPLRIELAGRTAEIDPKVGGTVLVRARGDDRASVTVEKGKLTLKSGGGQAMVLLSGETVDLTKGRPPERTASFVAVEPHRTLVAQQPAVVADSGPRGLGRMTARVPGRTDVVSGVRLVSHDVDVVLRDGIARTEVEEVFQNDTSQVLEGRYVFPLPADASISRLALWVNDKPVEGEIVEKKRAAAIFKGIVEDTVRPRDPALLEWVSGGDFSLKIFPLPPKGSRKVRIAYDQVVPESGGRVRYVYPLSVGAERATQIDDFSVHVRAADTRAKLEEVETPRYATSKSVDDRGFRIEFGAKRFTPDDDFIVSYTRQRADEAEVSAYVPSWGEFKGGGLDDAARGAEGTGYFALRVRADLPAGTTPEHARRDRAIVVDTSHSQSKETLAGEAKIAAGLVGQLDSDERFVVLACDSACVTFPESGLAVASDASLAELGKWLSDRTPTGSSDVAGALLDAARRLDAGAGQIVYIGDGSPTSGELSAAGVTARVRSTLAERRADLRFLGAGRAVDDVVVSALAESLGAAYEPVVTGESIEQRVSELALSLRSPVVKNARVDLPSSFGDVYPRTLRNLRLGEQVVLVGRLAANEPGEVTLRGDLDGKPYTLTRAVRWTPEAARQNPLVPRLWSLARISDLERSTDAATVKQVIDLSRRYHVMSRYTSLLVLENDQMFAEFGIKRTAPPAAGPIDDALAFDPGNPYAADDAEGAKRRSPDLGIAADKADKKEAPMAPPPVATMAPRPAAKAATQPFDEAQSRSAPGTLAAAEAPAAAAPAPAPTPSKPTPSPEPAPMEMDRSAGAGSLGGLAGSTTLGSGAASMGRVAGNVPMGNVQIGAPQVSGGLPGEVVSRLLRQSVGRFRNCYQMGLQRNPSLSGRMNLSFVIGQGGNVVAVRDAGSSLGDMGVTGCVQNAVRAVSFPQPSGGFVTVNVPLVFRAAETLVASPRWMPPSEPTAVHRAADDGWLTKGEDVVSKLRAALEQNPSSRKRYEDLVRGLLARGRFEEALATARRFVSMDPDLPVARELLAYAAVTNDDAPLAAASIDTQTETDPTSQKWHVRAARAFEAMGDERRACAHWRSLDELQPKSDEFAYEALRCRARILDDRDALGELRSLGRSSRILVDLASQLEAGKPPPFAKSVAGAGQFEVEMNCFSGERCPTVFVVSPLGNVFSPFTPTDARSSAKSVAFSGLRDGTYMTLVAGGSPDARGEVEVRTYGSTKKFPITRGGRQTVAATRVTLPSAPPPFRFYDGFALAF